MDAALEGVISQKSVIISFSVRRISEHKLPSHKNGQFILEITKLK